MLLVISQLSNNFIQDSYSLPPANSFAPDFHKRPSSGLTPPGSYPYSGSSSFKQYPIHVSAPRHPVSFRPPVPAGLLESIGQSVQHQDQFGIKFRPQSNIYLPPPTNEVPPPPAGLFHCILILFFWKISLNARLRIKLIEKKENN